MLYLIYVIVNVFLNNFMISETCLRKKLLFVQTNRCFRNPIQKTLHQFLPRNTNKSTHNSVTLYEGFCATAIAEAIAKVHIGYVRVMFLRHCQFRGKHSGKTCVMIPSATYESSRCHLTPIASVMSQI